MSAGGVWTSGSDSNSAARLNQKTVTIDTGTNLAAMASTYAGQLIFSTDTSGGFTANTLYERNAANSSWTAMIPMAIHDHSAATAAAGGLLTNVLGDNTGQVMYQTELLSPQAGDFNTTLSSGATVTNNLGGNQWRVNLQTGTTGSVGTPNGAQADLGGIPLDFGNPIKFQAKIEQQTATSSLQGRIGTNIEAAGASNLAVKSLGFEFCDSGGVLYEVESCDATTRSVTPTATSYNGIHGLKLLYTPSTNIVGTIDNATATTKTTNLPNSGACDVDKVMRFGIASTNATAKNLYIYGAVIVGVPNDAHWFV